MSEQAEVAQVDEAPDPALERRVRDSRHSGGLGRFIGFRILAGIGTLIFVLIFNFFLFHLLPGDPMARYRGAKNISPAQLEALRKQFDGPLLQQFWNYVQDPLALHSVSSWKGESVWTLIAGRAWPTIILLGTSTLVATVVGVWIGIRAGWNRGSRFDKNSTAVTLLFYATPEFWLGLILILLFSTGVWIFPGIFPSYGIIGPPADLNPWSVQGILSIAYHTVLPATALAAVYLAEYSLIMRASMVDESKQDYLTTARAKGLMDRAVRRYHAVPNASLPTVTLIFLNIGFIIGGAITVETVFSYPGLGLLTFQAIQFQDFDLIEALFLLFTISVIVFNIIADVAIAVIDPRIRK